MPPLRALWVTNMWPDEKRPWYGTFIHSQAESLRALGVEIAVRPIRGYESRAAYLKAMADLARLDGEHGFDVVHAHYGHAGVVARMQTRAPLVMSYCGDDLLGTRRPDGSLTPRSRAEAAVFRQLARVTAASITKSEEMERALPARARARNRVIPNGVDLSRFPPLSRAAAREELGWDAGEAVALFVGNPQVVSKNHPLAEQVVAVARRELPELRLRVAWGVAPERIPTLLRASDALLFTSLSEGSPNAVKEAMAAELPIVSTAVGDAPERLRGLPGCHVGPPDAERLAAALVEAVRHGRVPEAREAVAPLSVERVAGRVLDVYAEALGRRRARR